MNRRSVIKAMAMGTITPKLLIGRQDSNSIIDQLKKIFGSQENTASFKSQWQKWPDMEWAGPQYWGNRLQDWQLRGGKVRCSVSGKNRSLHCLTHQLSDRNKGFETHVDINILNQTNSDSDYAGFRVGARASDQPVKVSFEDYRRDAIFGEGLDAGISTDGKLLIGEKTGAKAIDLDDTVHLKLKAEPSGEKYRLSLSVHAKAGEDPIDSLEANAVSNDQLVGNIALVAHYDSENPDDDAALFSNWSLKGEKISHHPDRVFGPICFAQYTLHNQILKLTTQLAPVEAIQDHKVHLQIKQGYSWNTIQTTTVDPLSRTAHFRVEQWKKKQEVPYRLTLELPMQEGAESFYYNGTIAANPIASDQLKTAVFSCNAHYGFPNKEVVENVAKHQPDMAVFLGDQIYESHGGFGVQRAPVEKACLDYLRKWYMFGWSYRDIFRDIPCAIIPDDHDVYHGNVWGEGGRDAPTHEGYGAAGHDQGGYLMPPEWVNAVQRTQTSNLPDPYDPTPVKQDISVYYTDWNYGGVSFAILEDRKFKSAPKNVLPKSAQVENGFILNSDFDITKYYDIDADLLGQRQLKFLDHWAADWGEGTEMKAVLSQTNFCTVATLPEGSRTDSVVPGLTIPQKGTYIKGDARTIDMDSNGWPQKGRDKALRKIRKSFAFHIAGDQHLASTVQYGINEYGDAGYAFAGPALNNYWPRRWWPQVDNDHQPLPGRPKNTGNFKDGFGNHMSVYAVANPAEIDRDPGIIYDRATGYGIVTFNKEERTIRVECWPRYVDPASNPEGQYDGWPIVIRQEDNYGRRAATYLPELKIQGATDPVVQVYSQDNDELIYALRIKGQSFKPKVFKRMNYKIRIGQPDRNKWHEFENISPADKEPLVCKF